MTETSIYEECKRASGEPFDMTPDELADECRNLIDIIAAEFQSDPMSVQCFDLRIVKRTIKAAKTHRRYRDTSMF